MINQILLYFYMIQMKDFDLLWNWQLKKWKVPPLFKKTIDEHLLIKNATKSGFINKEETDTIHNARKRRFNSSYIPGM